AQPFGYASQQFAYRTQKFYDANGMLRTINAENRDGNTPSLGPWITQTFKYDILNERVSAIAPVDAFTFAVTLNTYRADGLPELLIKPMQNAVKTEYDERKLVFKVTRGFGSTTATPSTVVSNYDLNSNPNFVLDPQHSTPNSPVGITTVYD